MHRLNRRMLLAQGVALGASCLIPGRLLAQSEDLNPELTAMDLMTPETFLAIDQGLEYLASRQNDDGSFGTSERYPRNVAVVSLAGMAFISGGSTPGRGLYGLQVDRCIDYVLANTQQSGYIGASRSLSHGPMYGHGFATMFLAECYGMSQRTDLRERLAAAVKLIVNSQNSEGGWRYQPDRREADISVTICQVMALRAARNSGIYVPNETIERCIDYVKRSQNADGGFMYMLEQNSSEFPRSAAGVVALYSAGIYEGDEIRKGIEYLMEHMPQTDAVSRSSHYFYGHYYAVQAMWHAGGEHWQRWYPAIRDALLARQDETGFWEEPNIGREYGTAMACIILQMPNNYLPIFQR